MTNTFLAPFILTAVISFFTGSEFRFIFIYKIGYIKCQISKCILNGPPGILPYCGILLPADAQCTHCHSKRRCYTSPGQVATLNCEINLCYKIAFSPRKTRGLSTRRNFIPSQNNHPCVCKTVANLGADLLFRSPELLAAKT